MVKKLIRHWIIAWFIFIPFCFSQEEAELEYIETEYASGFNRYDTPNDKGVTNRLFVMIYEGLIRYDPVEEKAQPLLAESYEIDQAANTIVFHLRDNVKWHDGEPFLARDVEFTYNYIRTKNRFEHRYNFIKSITVLDPYTIRFDVTRTYEDEFLKFIAWIIPKHRFDSHFIPIEKDGRTINDFPIGTGPFKFIRRGLDGNIDLERNEDYWNTEKRAKLKRIKMTYCPDRQQASNMLVFGDKGCMPEVPVEAVSVIDNSGKFSLYSYNTYKIKAIAFNERRPLLNEPEIRRAMTIGTDRQVMLDIYYQARGQLLFGPFNKYAPYYNIDLEPWPYDPEQAITILEDAGYIDRNGDKIRESSDGKKLSFELVVLIARVSEETMDQHLAQNLITNMQDIGIEIKTRHMQIDDYNICLFRTWDYDLAIKDWTFDLSYSIASLFHSKEIYPDGRNIIGYNNPEMDTMLEKFSMISDRNLRIDTMNEVQETLKNECPYMFLFSLDNTAAIHRRYSYRIEPYNFFTYISEWTINY